MTQFDYNPAMNMNRQYNDPNDNSMMMSNMSMNNSHYAAPPTGVDSNIPPHVQGIISDIKDKNETNSDMYGEMEN